MFTTTYFEYRLATAFDKKQAKLLAEVVVEAYSELVKTSDFNELKSIVKELTVAQKELAAAQQRTEQRVGELTTAQQRTEQRVEELTTAQQRTEQRVGELTTAQQRTEQRMEELAVAQKELTTAQQHTETKLQQLIDEHKDTRKQLGGLATTVGYRLEDLAYKGLPPLLERDFGLIVQGKLKRTYITDNQSQELEVNITGQGIIDGKTVTIIGESKSQLSKNHVDSFIRKRLQRFEGVVQGVFPVLVTYMVSSSDVQEYAKKQGVAVYYSYDF